MKLTKNLIAKTYDCVVSLSYNELSKLTKKEFVDTIYSKVDEQLNKLFEDIFDNYYIDACCIGLDHNAPNYKKQLLNARKELAAEDLIRNYIANEHLDIIKYVLDKGIALELNDWGSDQFGAVVEYKNKEYIVSAHFSDEEYEKAGNDFSNLDWERLSAYNVKEY